MKPAHFKYRLYHYWRSSSSWRVRWAFAVKEFECEMVPINLLSDEAESSAHLARNPMGFVPALELLNDLSPDSNRATAPLHYLAESMAIIEWIEETIPEPSLLPGDALTRARIRQLSEIVNAGTQPVQNLNVMHKHSTDVAEQKLWSSHWIRTGLTAYETLVRETAGRFSVGDQLTLADLFLIPQCYNALRNEIPLSEFPTIARIHEAALALPSCQASHPDRYAPKIS